MLSKIFVTFFTHNAASNLAQSLHSIMSQEGPFGVDLHICDLGSTDDTLTLLTQWEDRLNRGEILPGCNDIKVTLATIADIPAKTALADHLSSSPARSNDFVTFLHSGETLAPGALALIAQVADQFTAAQVSWIGGSSAPMQDGSVTSTGAIYPVEILKAGLADGQHWPHLPSAGTFFRRWLWETVDAQSDLADQDLVANEQLWRCFAKHVALTQPSFALASSRPSRPDPANSNRIAPAVAVETRNDALTQQTWIYRQLCPLDPTAPEGQLAVYKYDIAAPKADPFSASDLTRIDRKAERSLLYKGKILEPADIARIAAHITTRHNVVAYDRDWQFPAITEQHAFHQMRDLGHVPDGVTYVAFPWATLIDKLHTNAADKADYQSALRLLKTYLPKDGAKITVCQHIKMRQYLSLFRFCGITHIFWSHATEDDVTGPPAYKAALPLSIRAFPLYPVQQIPPPDAAGDLQTNGSGRRYLFSFIGAKANRYYLSQARSWILDHLSGRPDGLVIGRDTWHYNAVVYDHQIRKTAAERPGTSLVDQTASDQFKTSLAESTFALCPSGTGPNSIRLWEALGAGSIPVLLADTLALPGATKLWQTAVLRVAETEDQVRAMPTTLSALAADPSKMSSLRWIMAQLWRLYGPQTFIYDIQLAMLAEAERQASPVLSGKTPTPRISTARAAADMLRQRSGQLLTAMADGNAARALTDPDSDALVAAGRALLPKDHVARVHYDNVAAFVQRHRPALAAPATGRGLPPTIFLLKGHGHRTPLAYRAFQRPLLDRLRFVDRSAKADIVMTGFHMDLKENIEELTAALRIRPSQRCVVLSEEPLWDNIWTGNFAKRDHQVQVGDAVLNYTFLNHQNSSIFDFDTLPYFILTQDDFITRYMLWLPRFSQMSAQQLRAHWNRAPIHAAFIAETRRKAAYRRDVPNLDVYALSVYRTEIARDLGDDGILRIGQGWPESAGPRQALPDWHLDKIETLAGRCRILSAYENTHQRTYISEKIFDAFVCGGIPSYFASPNHRIHTLVPDSAMINTFGLDSRVATQRIAAFQPDQAFAESWLETARKLQTTFSDVTNIVRERRRVAEAICDEIHALI